ncbi:MAG: hypothetical protein U0800_03910 [Isosphaeraceae bacterium]
MNFRWAWRASALGSGRRSVTRRRNGFRPALDGSRPLEERVLAAVDVLTYHNDLARTGQNLAETQLTATTVSAATFGKVGQVKVDGQVYAQPLVKTGVDVPGKGVRDLVFVATEHDSVYAFDANTLEPIWHVSFIDPSRGITTVPMEDLQDHSLNPEAGITSTPVIDPATGTIYVVSRIKITQGNSASYEQHLHALDVATGAEKFGGPTRIAATVKGKGIDSKKGFVSFDPLRENNRPGLLLLNGVVYAAFASIGDIQPYHGWLLGFDAQSLRLVTAFNTTPNGSEGGIWMSGGAPAVDAAGNIYLSVGNGTFSRGTNPTDLGSAVIKLSTRNNPLKAVDYFVPYNYRALNRADVDLGSGGIVLLPNLRKTDQPLLVTGGKMKGLFVLNRAKLGGFNAGGDQVYQFLRKGVHGIFSSPAYFNGKVYVVGAAPIPGIRQSLRSFAVTNNRLSATPKEGIPTYGWPGASPSISASGRSNGIVWTIDRGNDRNGILRAYDSEDVTRQLYDSTESGGRDTGSGFVKFSTPTIANGRVFVGGSSALTVYGLLG